MTRKAGGGRKQKVDVPPWSVLSASFDLRTLTPETKREASERKRMTARDQQRSARRGGG